MTEGYCLEFDIGPLLVGPSARDTVRMGLLSGSAMMATGIGIFIWAGLPRLTGGPSGPLLVVAAVSLLFGVSGVALVTTAFARGTEDASHGVVSEYGLVIDYPSGRRVSYEWADPSLNVTFLDFISHRDPTRPVRRVLRWQQGQDRTPIPPDAFDVMCQTARSRGARVDRKPNRYGSTVRIWRTRG